MAMVANKDPSPAYAKTVEEIMNIYISLPPRPSIEEVEAAISVINTVEYQECLRLEEISKQLPPQDVLFELFFVLQQVKKNIDVTKGAFFLNQLYCEATSFDFSNDCLNKFNSCHEIKSFRHFGESGNVDTQVVEEAILSLYGILDQYE
ncbi:Uncharacterized protein Fot_31742 [Forsythia ovata]|uniref:Uncharacterized protein n=1 Tax=Forsythia ovata TaxID=205694 RepID=A0ABD1T5T8_9LAMI